MRQVRKGSQIDFATGNFFFWGGGGGGREGEEVTQERFLNFDDNRFRHSRNINWGYFPTTEPVWANGGFNGLYDSF